MSRSTQGRAVPGRLRMSPHERRAQIVGAARVLFSERPYTAVSTGDVAAAAGVARSLVHHYFGGIREVFLAVVRDGGAALADVRTAGPETPLDERLARNVAAGLDVVAANRETWLAVAGHGTALADPEIRRLVLTANERNVERILEVNRDVLRDTPTARALLRCYVAFSVEATRAWLTGEQTRAATERLLVAAFRDLLLHTVPVLERDAADRGADLSGAGGA